MVDFDGWAAFRPVYNDLKKLPMKNFEIFTSKRKGQKMGHEGYCYSLRRNEGVTMLWRCTYRKCGGSARTTEDEISLLLPHNHDPNFSQTKSDILKSKILERAKETKETAKNIINKFLVGSNQQLAIKMPKIKNIADRITKIRRREIRNYKTGKNIIPEFFTKTYNNENFLLLDEKSITVDKVLLFSTFSNFIHLENADAWVCDGTFLLHLNHFINCLQFKVLFMEGFIPWCFV
jgi:hypothetical protein